jgi:8-oxo-dGTP pyrophosphatase MutT (NUDIX family)
MANPNIFWVNTRAIIERTNNGDKEVIVQWRNKKGQECWEFPGGCINMFEPLYDALKREVKEETGLDVISIKGENEYICEGSVECIKPFSVYQWLEDGGFGNPLGFHFICNAEGDLLIKGDETENIKWIRIGELTKILENEKFANSDKAAAMLYIKE